MADYRNTQVVIVGAGHSGRGLARFFLNHGAEVTLSDHRSAEDLPEACGLARQGCHLDLGGHTPKVFEETQLIVVSPGVPLNLPVLQEARKSGIPILGEIEIAWREINAPVIGITGTNGKSTVTTLIGAMLSRWGKLAFVGGNLGTPLIEAVEKEWDWLVVELSSFQLETIADFRPRYGLLLNITEDHLDRYPDLASYAAAKVRMFANMREDDVAVLNADDPLVQNLASGVKARIVWFSGQKRINEGMSLTADHIVWLWHGQESRFPIRDLLIKGQHNLENVMAAMIPLLIEGCSPEMVWAAAKTFPGLAHRMELVGTWGSVSWYDDSKATNIGSVVKSLAGLDAPVTLIAGGKDKMGDLSPLKEPISAKVSHLILLGEAAGRMQQAYLGLTEIHRVASMAEAVRLAAEITLHGGSVLLSPGCASFDMFKSFEERGRIFSSEVRALMQEGDRRHGN